MKIKKSIKNIKTIFFCNIFLIIFSKDLLNKLHKNCAQREKVLFRFHFNNVVPYVTHNTLPNRNETLLITVNDLIKMCTI